MTINKGDKVIATFPDGDQLTLTVREIGNEIYFFEETNLASWWYKTLCTKIN
jgi:hypothetical protein